MGKIFWEIYSMREILVITSRTCVCPSARTDCRGGGGEAGQPLGTGMFRQFSLAGNRVVALHLATRVFLVRNHIGERQWDKERAREKRRRNLRSLSEEILEISRGRRRRKKLMKIIVKLREIERETKHLFTTVSFQVRLVRFSFFNNKLICLAASHSL